MSHALTSFCFSCHSIEKSGNFPFLLHKNEITCCDSSLHTYWGQWRRENNFPHRLSTKKRQKCKVARRSRGRKVSPELSKQNFFAKLVLNAVNPSAQLQSQDADLFTNQDVNILPVPNTKTPKPYSPILSSIQTPGAVGYQGIGAGMWLLTDTSLRASDWICSQLTPSDKVWVQVKPKAVMINSIWLIFFSDGLDIDRLLGDKSQWCCR